MKFTFNWLKDHLDTTMSHADIFEKLPYLGIEVEEVIDNGKVFDGFVLGFVELREKHPDADKLSVCKVNIGAEIIQIVCGASNVKQGMKVAVALPGAVVPSNGMQIKKGAIRGIESCGMICSGKELGLSEESDGILDLSENDNDIGSPLAKALGLDDIIIDVSLTPNRSDCFSVRGIARDLAAASCGTLKQLNVARFAEEFNPDVDISIETPDCYYFSYRIIKDIKNLNAPEFINKRLDLIGQKRILPAVDIANYICIDVGQPLHVFDYDKLTSKRLIIRSSLEGEELNTLDGNNTILPSGSVVITDGTDVLSIAGIMGGEDTACSESTTNILIECALFDEVAIGTTGQKLRLISDSRTRFERGIDQSKADEFLSYTCGIIAGAAEGAVVSFKKAEGAPRDDSKEIEVYFEKFKNLTSLSKEEWSIAPGLLRGLEIEIIEQTDVVLKVKTPPHRHDLEIQEDIIEEILRLIGYDKIKEEPIEVRYGNYKEYSDDAVSDLCVALGLNEIKTFSFIDKKLSSYFIDDSNAIEIMDPLTVDYAVMRSSLIPCHIKALLNNQSKSQKNNKFFEIGKVFSKEGNNIKEENVLIITRSQKTNRRDWREPSKDVSIYDVKKDLEKILTTFNVKYRISIGGSLCLHPNRKGTYVIHKDTVVAEFGELHPKILNEFGLSGPVVFAQVYLDKLPRELSNKNYKTIQLSSYQPVSRDFSFLVDKSIQAESIMTAIKKLKLQEIREVNIFDVYESDQFESNQKAISFEVTIQSDDGTLSDDQLKDISNKIVDAVTKDCDGTLRDS